MSQLPDKLSDLIVLALADLVKVERSKKYEVNMGVWHRLRQELEGPRCAVCFAGAVMAKTLGAVWGDELDPKSFGVDMVKLYALNDVRCGNVASATMKFGLDHEQADSLQVAFYVAYRGGPPGSRWKGWPIYEDDKKGFRLEMRRLARFLRERGL